MNLESIVPEERQVGMGSIIDIGATSSVVLPTPTPVLLPELEALAPAASDLNG